MAGGVEHVDGQASQLHLVPLAVRAAHALVDRGEQTPGDPLHVPHVDVDGGMGIEFLQPLDAAGVVIVGVGQQNELERAPGVLDHLPDGGSVPAGVHHGADLGALVAQQVAIGANLAHGHGFYDHILHLK